MEMGMGMGFWGGQELDNPFVLVHEKKVSGLSAILPVLELALKVSPTPPCHLLPCV